MKQRLDEREAVRAPVVNEAGLRVNPRIHTVTLGSTQRGAATESSSCGTPVSSLRGADFTTVPVGTPSMPSLFGFLRRH